MSLSTFKSSQPGTSTGLEDRLGKTPNSKGPFSTPRSMANLENLVNTSANNGSHASYGEYFTQFNRAQLDILASQSTPVKYVSPEQIEQQPSTAQLQVQIPFAMESALYTRHDSTAAYNLSGKVPVSVIPERYRSIFPFENFNKMQSKAFTHLYESNNNCVVSSPTGSGKTVLFEIAIVKLLAQRSQGQNHNDEQLNAKIIYMAPTVALCRERYSDWDKKYSHLCKVGLLTGDTTSLEMDYVKRSTIVVCTPEKWDAITRRWNDYSRMLHYVKLLLMDEVHFLREKRGACLEAVTARMKTHTQNLRIIALSATIPNVQDVSNWLTDFNNPDSHTQTLSFGEDFRSVKISKVVYGYRNGRPRNSYQFSIYLSNKLPGIIRTYSKAKPVLIFCSTRGNVSNTAKKLAHHLPKISTKHLHFPIGIGKELIELIEHGVCYHHAGLKEIQRKYVEALFKKGELKILCSTSTLATGVNLPAYLVIINGTQRWVNGSEEEYSELDVLQMMGRAGRPQFETEGACVIMTEEINKSRYERLVKGTEKLESTLHQNMYEHITAEIVQGSITNIESAFNWLKSTFFYQRFKSNPLGYPGVISQDLETCTTNEQLQKFVEGLFSELLTKQMIKVDMGKYYATKLGEAMSGHYVSYQTMNILFASPLDMSMQQILACISASPEFDNIRMKQENKKLYRCINKNPLIRYPLEGTAIDQHHHKVYLIIQFELGGLEFPSGMSGLNEFLVDKVATFKNAHRVMRAAIDVYKERNAPSTLLKLMELSRCIIAKTWEGTSQVLTQFDGIGPVNAKKLLANGIRTIADAKAMLTRSKIERYLGMNPGVGTKIMRSIERIPDLDLGIDQVSFNGNHVKFKVTVNVKNEINEVCTKANGYLAFISVVAIKGKTVLDFRRLPLKKACGLRSFILETPLEYSDDHVKIYLNCDEIAGIGKEANIFAVEHYIKTLPNRINNDKQSADDVFSGDLADSIVEGSSDDRKDSTRNIAHEAGPLDNTYVTECKHKCTDKFECRHQCCKKGTKHRCAKMCKHICKDKSKGRHMCCREQFEFENGLGHAAARDINDDFPMESASNTILFDGTFNKSCPALVPLSDGGSLNSDNLEAELQAAKDAIKRVADSLEIRNNSGGSRVTSPKNPKPQVFFEKITTKPVKNTKSRSPPTIIQYHPNSKRRESLKGIKYAKLRGQSHKTLSNKWRSSPHKRTIDVLSDVDSDSDSIGELLGSDLKRKRGTNKSTGADNISVTVKERVNSNQTREKEVPIASSSTNADSSYQGCNETHQTTIEEKEFLAALGSEFE